MIGQLMEYLKQVFQNKEMIVMLIALIIVTLLVYHLHRMSVNHAWKTASAAGAVAGIVIVAAGSAMLGVNVSYPELLIGSVGSRGRGTCPGACLLRSGLLPDGECPVRGR